MSIVRRDGDRVAYRFCKCGKRTYSGTGMCNKCHIDNGGVICKCGKQINRGDSMCRDCFSSWKYPSEFRSGKERRSRVETTQVKPESGFDEMEFYYSIISPHALEGLKAWKDKQD